MRIVLRAICSVVLALTVFSPIRGFDKPAAPPKPRAAMPVSRPFAEKPNAAGKSPPPQETLEKRRERMKQRDEEIDRLLKGKQHRDR